MCSRYVAIGRSGYKYPILPGSVGRACCLSTAGVLVVRAQRVILCPSTLHCGLPLVRNVQNTDKLQAGSD